MSSLSKNNASKMTTKMTTKRNNTSDRESRQPEGATTFRPMDNLRHMQVTQSSEIHQLSREEGENSHELEFLEAIPSHIYHSYYDDKRFQQNAQNNIFQKLKEKQAARALLNGVEGVKSTVSQSTHQRQKSELVQSQGLLPIREICESPAVSQLPI